MFLLNLLTTEPSIVVPPNTDPIKVLTFFLVIAFILIAILLIIIIRINFKLNKFINQSKQ